MDEDTLNEVGLKETTMIGERNGEGARLMDKEEGFLLTKIEEKGGHRLLE